MSYLGSEISELAFPLLALLTLGATDTEVGTLRAVLFAPFLIATLPVGAIADRRRRRPLMIGADLTRFAATAAIPVAVWIGADGIAWLLPLLFVIGVGTVVYQIADYAHLPTLVDHDRLVRANSWLGASQSAAAIGGKGAGGALVAVLGAPVAVLADAATYAVSAINLGRIKQPEPPPTTTSTIHRGELTAGIRTVITNPYIRPLVGEATTYNLFNEAFITALLIHTAVTVDLSATLIGAIFMAGATRCLDGYSQKRITQSVKIPAASS